MKKVLRIIDVNANRAKEGLRVVEEIARFILEDEKLTARIKKMRSLVKSFTSSLKAEAYRRAQTDVGRKLYPESEASRENLLDIFKSNIKRSQEAVRCLEEFSKLISPSIGKKFKAIRFESYELETQMSPLLTKKIRLNFDLYLVTDPMRDHIKVIKEAIAEGIQIVQLRDKLASKQKYLKLARKIKKMTKRAGVIFIVNDNVEIAKKVDADGVHLGQKDNSPKRARMILGEDKIIGVSTHNLKEALKAQRDGADYISVGNIFETPSKPGKKGIGVRVLGIIRKKIKIPVVAIGGINKDNIYQIKNVGVDRVAGIRGIKELQMNREL